MNAILTDLDTIRAAIRARQAMARAESEAQARRAIHGERAPRLPGKDDPGAARQHINGRLEIVDAPDPDRPRTGAKIRRAQVYDPVKAAVRAWAKDRSRRSPYRCYLAAERFRADLARAAADTPIPSHLRPRIAAGGNGDAERRGVDWLAAKERVAAAWQAIGLAASGVVSWCVVPKPAGEGRAYGTLEGYDECRGWRKGRASEELESALHRLADHYRIGTPDMPRDFA
ncbi:MAG: hypothetical protein IRZ07_03835 [Microbispora sp.]|nr:hypothetical protein [Microbispora sp.]